MENTNSQTLQELEKLLNSTKELIAALKSLNNAFREKKSN